MTNLDARLAMRMEHRARELTFAPGDLSTGPMPGCDTAAALRYVWIPDGAPYIGSAGERWRRNVPLYPDDEAIPFEEVLCAYDAAGRLVGSAQFVVSSAKTVKYRWPWREPQVVGLGYTRVVEPWRRRGVYSTMMAHALAHWPGLPFKGTAIATVVERFFAAHAPTPR